MLYKKYIQNYLTYLHLKLNNKLLNKASELHGSTLYELLSNFCTKS